MRSPTRVGTLPAVVLDAEFFSQQGDFTGCLLELGSEPSLSLGPTTGVGDREARQRDRVQYTGLDVIWPMPGQAEARAICHLELRWIGEGSSS